MVPGRRPYTNPSNLSLQGAWERCDVTTLARYDGEKVARIMVPLLKSKWRFQSSACAVCRMPIKRGHRE